MQSEPIRRHADGSINYDFYRNRALTLRAETVTGFFKPFAAVGKAAVLAVVVIAAFIGLRPDQIAG